MLTPLSVVGLAAIGVFIVVAALRARFPYALEWMEGPMAAHIDRVLDGRALYGPPSLEFTAFDYPPLYYYLAAPVRALGGSLGALRLVSIAATGCSLVLVARFVTRETDELRAGIAAAGLVAAAFGFTGAFYDLARVDAVALALTLAGLSRIRTAESARAAAAGGFVMAAAVLTKQTALLPAAAAIVWAAHHAGRRAAAAYAAVLATTIGAAALVLEVTSRGWFGFYVRDVSAAHPVVASRIIGFWTSSFLPTLWPATMAAAAVLWRGYRIGDGVVTRFHLPVWGSMLLATYLVGIHEGAYWNTMISAVVPLSILAGVALARHPRRTAAAIVVALQFALFAYDPRPLVPDGADRRAADAVVAALESARRPVLMPTDPWYLERAGLPMMASSVALNDVVATHGHDARRLLQAEIAEACRRPGTLVRSEPLVRMGPVRCGPCPGDTGVVVFAERYFPPSGAHTAPASLRSTGCRTR